MHNHLDGGLCDCNGKRNPYKLRSYIDSSNNLIGTFCTECKVESLVQEYNVNIYDTTPGRLHRKKPPVLKQNTAFQVQCTNTEVNLRCFADILKPGDHVTWQRCNIYWHHGIISEIKAKENTIGLIHWNLHTQNNRFEILYSDVKVERQPMRRIDYPEDITRENPTELVVARARSRIGDVGYRLKSDNCETFATFCKSGVMQSHQIAWLGGKFIEMVFEDLVVGVKELITEAVRYEVPVGKKIQNAAGKVVSAEMIERGVKGSNWVGAGIVIATETGFVIFDVVRAYRERKNGTITLKAFIERAIQRIAERMVCSSLTVLGSFIGGAIGTPFGPLGIFIGEVIGGVVGNVAWKVLGIISGNVLTKQISSSLSILDDRVVDSIDKLHRGDHIVLYGSFFHPRCHAIVVEHDDKKIHVIRNTYDRGVVEEWLPFPKSLSRMEYGLEQCYDTETVLLNARAQLTENSRFEVDNEPMCLMEYPKYITKENSTELVLASARSRIGDVGFNLFSDNCKSFATYCKRGVLESHQVA